MAINNIHGMRRFAWPAASLLVNTRSGDWIAGLAKFSFLTFLLHGPTLLVLWLIHQKALSGLLYWIFWISTPLIIAAALAQIYLYSRRRFPQAVRFALGGR